MTYTIIYQRINDPRLDQEFYYAHIPALDLTTHGLGIEGAKASALDLLKLWIEDKKANNEIIPQEEESFYSKIELQDAFYS